MAEIAKLTSFRVTRASRDKSQCHFGVVAFLNTVIHYAVHGVMQAVAYWGLVTNDVPC